MATINLLPWREERRKQRQQEFYAILGVVALVAAGVVVVVTMFLGSQIDLQNERNTRLQQEIATLDQRIKKIEELDKTRSRLLQRKAIIEELQASRSQMVHLFDELVRTIPDGVRLDSIKQSGSVLTLEGAAQSNARVSAYMRSLDASPWLKNPDLQIVKADEKNPDARYDFILRITLQNPNEATEGTADAEAIATTGGAK
ncbi:MAG: PilN domain-containing protein [Xanthomonadales bacterium]|nr:PilN domain-containing protein [Xanthomonadales bacterium]MCB1641243.1 PilN domain-containing protein [Xanthomonadales bacterium]